MEWGKKKPQQKTEKMKWICKASFFVVPLHLFLANIQLAISTMHAHKKHF